MVSGKAGCVGGENVDHAVTGGMPCAMPTRRSLGDIYRDQRHLDATVTSRKRAGVFATLSVPIIVLTLTAAPSVVKITAWVIYGVVGVWAGVTSGRMAKREAQGKDGM